MCGIIPHFQIGRASPARRKAAPHRLPYRPFADASGGAPMSNTCLEPDQWHLSPIVIDWIKANREVSVTPVHDGACEVLKEALRQGHCQARGLIQGEAIPGPIDQNFWHYSEVLPDGGAFNISSLSRLIWFEVYGDGLGRLINIGSPPPHQIEIGNRSGRPSKIDGVIERFGNQLETRSITALANEAGVSERTIQRARRAKRTTN